MHLRKETIRIQEELGAYCRSGVEPDLPGVIPGRIHHYRRLVSNVVNDTLQTAFPITVAALGNNQWDQLVQDFFANGSPQTPQVWKLPLAFYHYHSGRETGKLIGKPYLDDLLCFEWMEIEVHTMPDRPHPDFVSAGDLLKDRLVFNPAHEIVKLEYPVHTHPVDEAMSLKGAFYALLYRLPESGTVQFLDLSGLNVYIITRLQEEQLPLNRIKNEFARVAGIESVQYLDDALKQFLGDLLERQLILGFEKESATY
jgi:hypothetical protein